MITPRVRWLALPLLAGLVSAAMTMKNPPSGWWAIVFGVLCLAPLARHDRYIWIRRVSLVAASWVALRVSIVSGTKLYTVLEEGPHWSRLAVVTAVAGGLGALLVGVAARILLPMPLRAKSMVLMVALASVAGGVLGLGSGPFYAGGVFLWQLTVGGALARARAETMNPKYVVQEE